jgi:hypothetical protein
MIRFFKNLFKGKDPGPAPEAPYKVEAPTEKVEAVNAQPVVAEKPAKAPAKKRTFVKREDSGVAKVAPVKAKPKAPAKPRAPAKPKAK